MSLYHKGNLITSIFIKGQEINKGWSKGHLIFSKPLYKFLTNIKQMGITIDESAYSKAYYSIDSSVLNSAKVILLPFISDTGIVYGMDNRTGDVIPFTFSRATSATLFDTDKNMQLVGNDVPRIDYVNYSDSAKLLIEKEATNLWLDSDILTIYNPLWDYQSVDWLNYFTKGVRLYHVDGGQTTVLQRILSLQTDTYVQSNFARTLDGSPVITGTSGSPNAHYSYNSVIRTEQLINNAVCRTSGTYNNTAELRWFGLYKYATNNVYDVLVSGFQVELGGTPTSYIPTSGSQVTRSADLLSIDLQQASSIYLKTTKQETTLSKPVGIWNIDQDLNNEGIEVLAVMQDEPNDGIKAIAHKYTYQGTFMGECFLRMTVESESPVNFEIGDYVVYRGERFILNYIPAKEKQARNKTYGSAFVYNDIKLNSYADELTRVEFLDVVLNDNGIHYTSQPSFRFYAKNVQDLADRIQANLNRVYTGSEAWTVTVSPDVITPDREIVINNIKVWDAVLLANKEFSANFIIRDRTITIGTAGIAVGRVFGYGKGNGLYDIQQVTNEDALIITRLRAYGSTRNLPNRYYNKLKDEDGNPYIVESAYIPNLMLPAFPYEIQDPKNVFIDSAKNQEYGIREGSVYFDGADGNIEIYPSLEGMTQQQLADAGITVSLPPDDNGNIDEVLGADNPTDNGEIPEEPESIEGQFTIYLKDLGFDLSERDENGQYIYATTDTMQISMKSGMCIGRTFDIVENGIVKDTSPGYTRFVVTCNRFSDTSIQMAYPNKDWKIEAKDKFVLLGISKPEVYIKTAAQKLLSAAQEYLSQNEETKYTYLPKIDELFMANNPSIGESIKEGDIFNFTDTDLDIDASVIIQSLKISEVDKLIPTYEVTLSNDRVASTFEKMQNTINSLMINATGITLDQVKSLINSIGGSLFLSKRYNDTAQGLIKFVKGIDISDFTSGAFGSGGTFREQSGDSYLEVDKLFVRKWARFTEILIERLSHIGGSLVISPARMICSEVEELADVYRCYFDTGDGEFVQEFVAGDQARCQVFTGTTQKYYWRLVTNIGENYIDLSKTDIDSGSGIPEAGDHIVQLGNRDNTERQNAQILSSFGSDAPSYKQYQGINSYFLSETEKNVFSPSGNKLDGRVTIMPGSTGWENLQGLPEEFQDLSTGAVNLLRNSGFTGDYESRSLNPTTSVDGNTEMYSEHLKYWDGQVMLNNDGDSKSGFSVTLINQMLSQTINPLVSNENYILSFRAKGTSFTVDIGGLTFTESLTNSYQRYIIKVNAIEGNTVSISGTGTLCEIQLERGRIVSDWSQSPLDNNKSLAQYEAIRYISDSIRNGSTSILGGLILSSMIQLGNYVNGEMKAVTSGMSGVYNDDTDVAFWAGGTLSQAIANAVNPFTTDEDKMINFLVTHGGMLIANEAVIRGNITATSGTIGGFIIDKEKLQSVGKDTSGNPNIILNGITGEALITGKVQSNNNGDRILIDPVEKALKFIDQNDNVSVAISRYPADGSGAYGKVSVFDNLNDSNIIATLWRQGVTVTNNINQTVAGIGSPIVDDAFAIRIGKQGENSASSVVTAPRFFVQLGASHLLIFANFLPTDSSGLLVGQVWNNNGALSIVI